MVINDTEKRLTNISVMRVGTADVLTPVESLTYENCKSLEDLVNELISKNKTRIIIDFKAISLMDSKMLELLLNLHRTLKDRGGNLKLAGLNSVCRDILLATRLINHFDVYEDIPQALRD